MKTFAKCLLTVSMGTVIGCSLMPTVIAPAPAPAALAASPPALAPAPSIHESTASSGTDKAAQIVASGPYLVAISANVYELRDRAAPPQEQAGAPVKVQADQPLTGHAGSTVVNNASDCALLQRVQIEISNGAGTRLLARRSAERLGSSGVATARLTNQPRFDQARTEIQFAAGQENAASALSALLPTPVKLVAAKNFARNIPIRLVLGLDFSGDKTALWLNPITAEKNQRIAAAAAPIAPASPASCSV